VRTVRYGDAILFNAKDVAESLGYTNPRKAIRVHVWKINKVPAYEIEGRTDSVLPLNWQPHTLFLREQGLYQLILNSRCKL
jgi:prophage antirepressor-like protein